MWFNHSVKRGGSSEKTAGSIGLIFRSPVYLRHCCLLVIVSTQHQVHSHRKRTSHSPAKVMVPEGPWTGPLHGTRQQMSLFAVTCIETSHYVSFVKHGPLLTDWLFFDSMADREGENLLLQLQDPNAKISKVLFLKSRSRVSA